MILSSELQSQLSERFQGSLREPVELRLTTAAAGDACPTCGAAEELVSELASLSDGRLEARVVPDASGAGAPRLEVARPGEESRVSFLGLPAGYEFATLVDAIERISSTGPGFEPGESARLEGIAAPVEVMVFVTPTCPYCPGAASTANRMAIASDQVRALIVEANEFPDLADEFGVQGVPKTVVNRSGEFVGALPPAAFVERVLAAGQGRA